MSKKDIERMKEFIEAKKSKGNLLQSEKKIGAGKVEKGNRTLGIDSERTYKISQ